MQVSAQRADGEVFPAAVLVRITRLDADQRLILVFAQDISEQVEYETRLQDAADEARRYATAQRRFLATMSHELRTPLHGVRAALDLLRRQSLSGSASKLVEIAQQSCIHALQQTDSALDAIRATHENEPIVVFDPVRIATDLTAEMALIGQDDGTRINLDVRSDGGGNGFLGRPRAFGRALGNLIANATKYAPGGNIIIRLDFAPPDQAGQVVLRAEVIDDGPGIPADRLDRIFEPFNHDLLPEQKHDGGGFGLGLSIVKQAVAVMGGDITVQSDIGQGCHVVITVPLIHAGEGVLAPSASPMRLPQARTHSTAQRTGQAALVVDDTRINCALVAQMLGELGYRVDTAFSGQDAVNRAANKAYDLILMDFHMPGLTGPEAAARIKFAGASAQSRIIGITARVDLMGSDAGAPPDMDRVLFKPFGLAELEACLNQGTTQAVADDFSPSGDEMALLHATLQMCGDALGMALLHDTLSLAMQALSELTQDPASCAETAHRAAGAAMMAGFHDLGHALRALEQAARMPADGGDLESLGDRLASATEKAQATLVQIEAMQKQRPPVLVS
ncbi:hybrid sensor histidine kinase/response regulator [Roseicyclus sp.]|uniref:hybrid sensor histidine kinase/response regulator n=1 Tax=Roseicyclus sp. TaxID=1914329 RepID=UPI003F6CEE57